MHTDRHQDRLWRMKSESKDNFSVNSCPSSFSVAHDIANGARPLGAYPISSRTDKYRGVVRVGVVHQVEAGLTG